ncbi:D-sedoheptulose 7-phosphate isomerase [Desulfurispirillum indicum]|uniref:Phosphoheptose isomerase n=1 Tax=Desulfurispirillum indicum (strain ATCC BAA-1389 / DSM 22839 / S5) TaxID=653733 RepID=E6W284_DESIS|nr:D-sedoheptulose 7-phosphate isomerase [Desulfurispirillum indicum]ADU65542.1 sugar isomerase (SIS) [Desulfurispirillum indicum S5]UCZ57624.1 D-sedoheptulose 7-phosphate isomerase [Desulfurispirillum indicum]
MDTYDIISRQLKEHRQLLDQMEQLIPTIATIADVIAGALRHKHKVLLMGNGGSASDAMHMAGELLGRFLLERHSYPAIALCADNAAMTAIANDYGYENVFRRQVEGLCQGGDIVFGISTSGNSPNVISAMEEAHRKGGVTISLSGRDGGKLAAMTHHSIIIPSPHTPRIQEMHIMVIHILCDLIEKRMEFG